MDYIETMPQGVMKVLYQTRIIQMDPSIQLIASPQEPLSSTQCQTDFQHMNRSLTYSIFHVSKMVVNTAGYVANIRLTELQALSAAEWRAKWRFYTVKQFNKNLFLYT